MRFLPVMSPVVAPVSRVALVRPDRIGDCVIGSAAVNDLRAALPGCEILWVVRKAMAPLFSGRDFPAKLLAYDESAGPAALARRLEDFRPDAVVLLSPHPLTDAAAALCGAPVRIGFKSVSPGSLTAVSGLDKEDGRMHEAEYARDLLRLLPGVRAAHLSAIIPCVRPVACDDEWRALLGAAADSGFFAVHPGAHGAKARLPVDFWAAVTSSVTKKTGYTPVLIGDAESATASPWPDSVPALDLRGRLSLGATARMLAASRLCLSRDSGPAHVAAAVGCPTVCVFLENTPKMGPVRWTPLGPRVRTVVPSATPRWYERVFFALYRRRAIGTVAPAGIISEVESLMGSPQRA